MFLLSIILRFLRWKVKSLREIPNMRDLCDGYHRKFVTRGQVFDRLVSNSDSKIVLCNPVEDLKIESKLQ